MSRDVLPVAEGIDPVDLLGVKNGVTLGIDIPGTAEDVQPGAMLPKRRENLLTNERFREAGDSFQPAKVAGLSGPRIIHPEKQRVLVVMHHDRFPNDQASAPLEQADTQA